MTEQITLVRGSEETKTELDPALRAILEREEPAMSRISERGGGEDWDAPLDLRVARPRANDLRAMWKATGAPLPAQLAGALGATRPILLTHTVTPFPVDGRSPARVWALGYELVAHNINADTVAVVPSDEVYKAGEVGQTLTLGIEAGGKFAIAGAPPGSNFGLRASTNQRLQFEATITVTLRKVVGAPVGTGGAQWKMFRQNEPLDQPHTLLQLILVPENAEQLRCTVKTWATQAGRLGTGWGAKFWPYKDQPFTVSLT